MKKTETADDLFMRYEWIRRTTDEAISKRSSVTEFHGLEQELREMQLAILESYNRTKPITHPRDKGDHREEILRHFLASHGLIPSRYGVSSVSTRVVAPSGHISPELDILFYERDDAIVLKKFANTLEYYPIESVHGTIQVKSKLSKVALRDGLENIRQFKSIAPSRNLERNLGGLTLASGLHKRFGILFAYEYDLTWDVVYREISDFARNNPPELLPNLIFILDRGHFLFGDEERKIYCWRQRDLAKLESVLLHGFPDHDGSCLLKFYDYLIALLKGSDAGSPSIEDYIRMPLTAGEHSYSHSYGAMSELATCPTHGSFLKTFTQAEIGTVLAQIEQEGSINWIKAIDLANGKDGTDEEAYNRQPRTVQIFNPDKLPLSDILTAPNGTLTFEDVKIDGKSIWIPHHYCDRYGFFDCPSCLKTRRKRKT